jgi:hypothetical protein
MLTFIALLLLSTGARSSSLDSLAKSSRGRMSLSGPRFGVSLVKGDNADRLKERFDVKPIVTQFGWQFETRFLSTTDGFAGLSEWIPLVAGVEQGVFLPSLSWLIGFRSAKGNEIGFGPNISLGGVGLVLAGGITARTETLNFPFNVAVALYKQSVTISLLVGFNAAE